MSAVSSRVMPRSSALWTTLREASRSMRPPKLLQPSPTTETSRPDLPRLRCFTTVCPFVGEAVRSAQEFARVMPQMVVDEAGDEIIGMVVALVPAQTQLLAGFPARFLEELRAQLLGE